VDKNLNSDNKVNICESCFEVYRYNVDESWIKIRSLFNSLKFSKVVEESNTEIETEESFSMKMESMKKR